MRQRQVKRVERPVWTSRQPVQMRRTSWQRPPQTRLGLIPRRLLVLTVITAGLVFSVVQFFAIKQLKVVAPGDHAATLEQAVRKQMASSGWQRNMLTVDTEVLEAGVLKADPMLKTLVIRRQWPGGLALTATLKQPSLGWMSGNQAYLLDRDGSAIGLLPAGSAVTVVVDGSNVPVTLGQRVASSRFVNFMNDVPASLTAAGVAVTRYEVKETTLDLYVTTNKGYRLVLDTGRPAAEQGNDLKTLLAFLAKQGKVPAEYIDLRIAGKAYYK